MMTSWIVAGRLVEDVTAKPVRHRLLVPLAGVLLLLIGGFAIGLLYLERESLKQSSLERLRMATRNLDGQLEEQTRMLSVLGDVLLTSTDLVDAIGTGDRDRLLAETRAIFTELRSQHGVTHLYFHAPDRVNRFVQLGSSPRGAQALILGGKVNALRDGRFAVAADDVRAVAFEALRHRMLLNFEAMSEGVTTDHLVTEVLEGIE